MSHSRGLAGQEKQANERLRRGLRPSTPLSLPYRMIASSCASCGDLVSYRNLRRDQPAGKMHHACRTVYVRLRRETDEGWRRSERENAHQYHVREQRRTEEAATRRGQMWTGPELEIAARRDLTAAQAAVMLGRTLNAVKHVRKQLRTDPRKIRLANVPTWA